MSPTTDRVYVLCDTYGYPVLVFKDVADAEKYRDDIHKKFPDEHYTVEVHTLF